MKRLHLFSLLLCLLVVFGCQRNLNDDYLTGDVTSITATLSTTRTSLGGKVGDNYPVYWSDADCIAVNGVKSQEAIISTDNRSAATFEFSSTLQHPYRVTYPFHTSTTASTPIVEFKAVQNYTEGSFDKESVPMCGYAATESANVTMSHLSTLLRLPVRSSSEGVVLSKIVITATSGAKIAGAFEVDCSSATITAQESATSTISYLLPDNFTLSQSEDAIFYISLPATTIGDCVVEFVDGQGNKMSADWAAKNLRAGVVREFKSIVYREGMFGALDSFEIEEDYFPTNIVTGYVREASGMPIEGVAVSDGFSVVTTNNLGAYSIDVSNDAWYIYISIPSEYEIPLNEYGQPYFYKKYQPGTDRYDFTLKPLAGGKEEKFALFVFGDPQVSTASAASLRRFRDESIPAIKKHATEVSSTMPCYGITLGDVISTYDGNDSSGYRDDVRDEFAASNVGLPVFQVMGNHDNNHYNSSKPIYADERSSTFELKAQREHEDMFGPVNYSFNRGDTHIIAMRNIIYGSNTTSAKYQVGFLAEQVEWLRQDLAVVPKDKVVVLNVHHPMYNDSRNLVRDVLALLNEYQEAHIMSGHLHVIHTYDHACEGSPYTKVFEHNVGAICGAWWTTNMCGCGAPNGYAVFEHEGNKVSDWYYIGINEGLNKRAHQMRLYRGNAITGGAISGSNNNGTKGYYAFCFGEDILLANVYFSDKLWKIEVYEDGVYTGDMELMPKVRRPVLSELLGDGSYANPFTSPVPTCDDMYNVGLQLGVLGRAEGASGTRATCFHMYKYQLKNKDAEIKVVAIDRFGNEYTETEITEGTDYTLTKKP